jgi:transcription elongation factor Elf1
MAKEKKKAWWGEQAGEDEAATEDWLARCRHCGHENIVPVNVETGAIAAPTACYHCQRPLVADKTRPAAEVPEVVAAIEDQLAAREQTAAEQAALGAQG